jgi:hypothetical protein
MAGPRDAKANEAVVQHRQPSPHCVDRLFWQLGRLHAVHRVGHQGAPEASVEHEEMPAGELAVGGAGCG